MSQDDEYKPSPNPEDRDLARKLLAGLSDGQLLSLLTIAKEEFNLHCDSALNSALTSNQQNLANALGWIAIAAAEYFMTTLDARMAILKESK